MVISSSCQVREARKSGGNVVDASGLGEVEVAAGCCVSGRAGMESACVEESNDVREADPLSGLLVLGDDLCSPRLDVVGGVQVQSTVTGTPGLGSNASAGIIADIFSLVGACGMEASSGLKCFLAPVS
jgi:hypothetical protein